MTLAQEDQRLIARAVIRLVDRRLTPILAEVESLRDRVAELEADRDDRDASEPRS